MRYFRIERLGDFQDPELAIIDSLPEELGGQYRLGLGKPVAQEYPADARTYLKRKRGRKLASLIGCTRGPMIVHLDMKEPLEKHCPRNCEILPLSIYNDRKKLLSADYFIINPLGTFDCVDRGASDIEYEPDDHDAVVGVNKFVFNRKKLTKAPALFRVPEERCEIFVNQTVARAWKDKGCTNVFLEEIDIV